MTSQLPSYEQIGLLPAVVSTASNAYATVRKHAGVIATGRILAIDPSIGSLSSQPGYAMFENGVLIDCGILEGRTSGTHSHRLFAISRSLREEFTDFKPDCLVIEAVPVSRFSKGRGGRSYSNPAAQVPLHRAVGAILASVDAPLSVEVAPSTWHRFTDPDRYIKSDVADAIALGFSVVCMARHAVAAASKPKKKRVTKQTKGSTK